MSDATQTLSLTDFLLARIAEDEEVAQTAAGPWVLVGTEVCTQAEDDLVSHPTKVSYTAHIARHDPARVLAECEAKRRIVDLFPRAARDGDGWNEAGLQVLELLALPYAEHPDYRGEWKP